MDRETAVQKANEELTGMIEEAKRFRENPRLIRVMELLQTLTSSDDDLNKAEQAAEEAKKPKPVVAAPVVAHKHTPNIYGKCSGCGQCLHTNLHSQTGDCITCGLTAKEIAG